MHLPLAAGNLLALITAPVINKGESAGVRVYVNFKKKRALSVGDEDNANNARQ